MDTASPPTKPSTHSQSSEAVTTTITENAPTAREWSDLRPLITPGFRFLAGNWFPAWGDHLITAHGWQRPMRYITSRTGSGAIVGVIPVAIQSRAHLRFLSLAGLYVPFRGFPVSAAAVTSIAQNVVGQLTRDTGWSAFRFGPVPEADPLTIPLIAKLRAGGWRVNPTPSGSRQLIQLPPTWEEFVERLSQSGYKNILRRERKMHREQDATVKLYSTDDDPDWSQVVHDLGVVEMASWLPKHGGDLRFSNDANNAYWTTVLSANLEDLKPRVWIVYFGDTPVGFDFNFDSGPCRYSVAALHDQSTRAYGLGFMLLKCEIEDAIQCGRETIDLGVGDPGHKQFWTSAQSGRTLDVIAFRPGLGGAVLTTAFQGLDRAKRLQEFFGRLSKKK